MCNNHRVKNILCVLSWNQLESCNPLIPRTSFQKDFFSFLKYCCWKYKAKLLSGVMETCYTLWFLAESVVNAGQSETESLVTGLCKTVLPAK